MAQLKKYSLDGPSIATEFEGSLTAMETPHVDEDFHGWLVHQAEALHSREYSRLDSDALAEELESMAASERRELRKRLHVLLLHLLKWQTQPHQREHRGRGWKKSMLEARRQISDLINDSHSLRRYLPELIEGAWGRACEDALEYVPSQSLPDTCPWPYEVFIARDFLPDQPESPASS